MTGLAIIGSENVNPLWLLDALQLLKAMFQRGLPNERAPGLTWVPQAREMLAGSGPSDMSLEDVAQELGVGYETFRKTFRCEVGMSPGEYRHRKRFEYAIELLLDQSATIQSVADTLGYGSTAAFVKQFTARVGMPPGRFREQHQNR